jgi:hypothetical protein
MKKLEIKEPQNWHQNDHPEDVARILRILEKHGYMASKPQATRLWLLCSSEVGASWLKLPHVDDAVWEQIAEYIKGEQGNE